MMTMIQIINKLLLLLSLRASLPSLFLLEPPCPSSRLLFHVLVVVGAAKVGNPPIVVIAEIGSSSSAAVADVVHSLSGFEIPVKLSRLQRAPGASVPSVQSLCGDVEVLPGAEHVLAARVEAIRAMLVAIVVIVPGGETVLRIIPVVVSSNFIVARVIPASTDCPPVGLLPTQLSRIGNHLAIKIGIMAVGC